MTEVGGSAFTRYGLMRWTDEIPVNRSGFQLVRGSGGARRLSIPYSERPVHFHAQKCDGIEPDIRIARFFIKLLDVTFIFISYFIFILKKTFLYLSND